MRGEWRGDVGTERVLQEGKAAPEKNADFTVCPYPIKVTINGKLQRSLNGNKCTISISPIPVSLGLCLYHSEGPRAIIPKYTCPPRIKRDWEESCVTQKQKDTLSRAETQTRRKRWWSQDSSRYSDKMKFQKKNTIHTTYLTLNLMVWKETWWNSMLNHHKKLVFSRYFKLQRFSASITLFNNHFEIDYLSKWSTISLPFYIRRQKQGGPLSVPEVTWL